LSEKDCRAATKWGGMRREKTRSWKSVIDDSVEKAEIEESAWLVGGGDDFHPPWLTLPADASTLTLFSLSSQLPTPLAKIGFRNEPICFGRMTKKSRKFLQILSLDHKQNVP